MEETELLKMIPAPPCSRSMATPQAPQRAIHEKPNQALREPGWGGVRPPRQKLPFNSGSLQMSPAAVLWGRSWGLLPILPQRLAGTFHVCDLFTLTLSHSLSSTKSLNLTNEEDEAGCEGESVPTATLGQDQSSRVLPLSPAFYPCTIAVSSMTPP